MIEINGLQTQNVRITVPDTLTDSEITYTITTDDNGVLTVECDSHDVLLLAIVNTNAVQLIARNTSATDIPEHVVYNLKHNSKPVLKRDAVPQPVYVPRPDNTEL